jgi:hypothetical protein
VVFGGEKGNLKKSRDQMSEIRSRRSEIGDQKSASKPEVRDQKSEISSSRKDAKTLRSEGSIRSGHGKTGDRMSEIRSQHQNQKSEVPGEIEKQRHFTGQAEAGDQPKNDARKFLIRRTCHLMR